ncbi:hypothetical protein GCM10012288_03440 [Malaciobacter pacificus]|uniref:hypothetical protein n=1 Tax=Malaciobacter pacificus TaxID=1080223 RepID=UPI00102A873B|nr:hypothetical protein [Malaciobacter pacificus]GGD32826.1 hypothetical protein GCM10012288_03440 [Malaciobacter pacificus]
MCINQFKDTKYQELQTIQKEARNLESQINAIKFQNQKQSIVSPTDGYVAKLIIISFLLFYTIFLFI